MCVPRGHSTNSAQPSRPKCQLHAEPHEGSQHQAKEKTARSTVARRPLRCHLPAPALGTCASGRSRPLRVPGGWGHCEPLQWLVHYLLPSLYCELTRERTILACETVDAKPLGESLLRDMIVIVLKYLSTREGNLLHYWWECKLVQLLWETVCRYLKKLKI